MSVTRHAARSEARTFVLEINACTSHERSVRMDNVTAELPRTDVSASPRKPTAMFEPAPDAEPWSVGDSVAEVRAAGAVRAVTQPGATEWIGLLDDTDTAAGSPLSDGYGGVVDMDMYSGKEQTVTPPDNGASTRSSSSDSSVGRGGLLSEQTIGEEGGWELDEASTARTDGDGGGGGGGEGWQEPPWLSTAEPEHFGHARVHSQVLPVRREIGGSAPGSSRELASPRGGISKRAKPVSLRAFAKAKRSGNPSLIMTSMTDTPFRTDSSMSQSEDWGHNQNYGSAAGFGDNTFSAGVIFDDQIACPPASMTNASHVERSGGGVEAIEEAVMELPPVVLPRADSEEASPALHTYLDGGMLSLLIDQPIVRQRDCPPATVKQEPTRFPAAAAAAARAAKHPGELPPPGTTLEAVLHAATMRTL